MKRAYHQIVSMVIMLCCLSSCNKGRKYDNFIGTFYLCKQDEGSVTSLVQQTPYHEQCANVIISKLNDSQADIQIGWNSSALPQMGFTTNYIQKNNEMYSDTCFNCSNYRNSQVNARVYYQLNKLRMSINIQTSDTSLFSSQQFYNNQDSLVTFDINLVESKN